MSHAIFDQVDKTSHVIFFQGGQNVPRDFDRLDNTSNAILTGWTKRPMLFRQGGQNISYSWGGDREGEGIWKGMRQYTPMNTTKMNVEIYLDAFIYKTWICKHNH